MDDLFFPLPATLGADPMLEAYTSDTILLTEPVVAQRNPVADPYLNAVYDFGVHPENSAWLLDSGWAYMPEMDRDGFVAAIIELFPAKVEALQTLYMGAFGRLGDPEGLAFWTLNMVNHVTNDPTALLSPTINAAPEYVGMLKSVLADQPALAPLNTGAAIETYIRTLDASTQHDLFGRLIDNMYENIFGREADAGGKTYWTGKLETSSVDLVQLMGALINSASANDKALLGLKSDIAYDAVTALVEHNVMTTQDINRLGAQKVATALTTIQERLAAYDAHETTALQANRETLIAQLLKDVGVV
jgi:hypothetical protein